ncbi:MAG: hypothetical protein DCF20_02975 [Pseudanabaena sp.]|nr:MAG: hypothetical protein DCF20_02975 [Pseudanabaena sp.]
MDKLESREFYPKNIDFKTINDEEFQKVEDFMNHRPRKSLDYRKPYKESSISSDIDALHI